MSKCPSCGGVINRVNVQGTDVYLNGKKRWLGALYTCPLCAAVLSAGIDPVALKADVVDAVTAELKKALRR